MSIRKITQSEIKELGISALPERPSAPSLYSGKAMTAEELRAAFDRLPCLLAERFNALLAGTGLYSEGEAKDTLAALIATHITAGHSLEDLFADVKSGELAFLLPIDGDRTLGEVVKELIAITELPAGTASLRAYVDAPKGKVAAGVTLPVSGGEVFRYTKDLAETVAAVGGHAYRLVKNTDGSFSLMTSTTGAEGSFTPVAGSDTLTFPADAVLDSGTVEVCDTDGVPLADLKAGEKYLDLVLANAHKDHVYVAVEDLVDTLSRAQTGEGDLVSDVTVSGSTLTLVYGKSSTDLVAAAVTEAKAYADAPAGKLTATETRPVSGATITAALKDKLDKEDLSPIYSRVKRLEDAAVGTLYSFEEVKAVGEAVSAPADTAPFAVLSEIGGLTRPPANLLNPTLLKLSDILEVSYDPETQSFLLNGSLEPIGDQIICLDFLPDAEGTYGVYIECLSGSATNGAYFQAESDYGWGEVGVGFPTVPGTFCASLGTAGENGLRYIGITAYEPVTFTDYRCRFLVCKGESLPDTFVPFGEPPVPTLPTALSIKGKNFWRGSDATGETSVTITPPVFYLGERISISFVCASTDTQTDTCYMEIYFYGGSSPYTYQLPRGVRTGVTFDAPARAKSLTVYAAASAENAAGKQVSLSAIQVERGEVSPYVPYHASITVALPEEIYALEDFGHGLSAEFANGVDLLNGRYIQRVASLTLDGSETDWSYADGVFTLPVSLQAPYLSALTPQVYGNKAMFPLSAVTLSGGNVLITTESYTTVEALTADLAKTPLTIWYPTMERYSDFDSEWADTAYLSVSGNDQITFAAKKEPARVYSRLLFEIPNDQSTEVVP